MGISKEEKYTIVKDRQTLVNELNALSYCVIQNCKKNGELQGFNHIAVKPLVELYNALYPEYILEDVCNKNLSNAMVIYNRTAKELR